MIIYSIVDLKKNLYCFAFRNKYDTISTEISQQIFQSIISGKTEFNKSYENFEVKVILERTDTDYIEESPNYFTRFKTISTNEGFFESQQLKKCEIIIKIILAKGFSEKDYESLNYRLYEICRHELEHRETYLNEGEPSEEYRAIFNQISQASNKIDPQRLREHCQLVSQYILDVQELSSYAKSLYYYSKKTHRKFEEVIQEALERIFYNNDSDIKSMAKKDTVVIRLFDSVKEALIERINRFYLNSKYHMASLFETPFYKNTH
jgi:hypothetical protein